jgi:aldose 1-epimerase
VNGPSGEQIEIAHGDERAVIVEVGGGLRTYSAGGRELLDGYAAGEKPSSGRGQVLAPWPNRIRDGLYEFDARQHQLPLNEPDRGNAIHGLVRQSPWRAAERAASRVVMEHILDPQPGYPFSLTLRIDYRLSDEGLSARMTATNTGTDRCPYGTGAHPYLTIGNRAIDMAVLRVPARTVLSSDVRGIPDGSASVEDTEYDFVRPRTIGATKLDHAFTDLVRDEDGLARVHLSDADNGGGLTLWVDGSYGYLMLFSGDPLPDVNRRSLAVEPMTCPPNAFQSEEALIVLEPGQSVTSAWGIGPMRDRGRN